MGTLASLNPSDQEIFLGIFQDSHIAIFWRERI